MTTNNIPYFIYLDSKIVGAARQIVTFFNNGIFPIENTVILIKKYKHKSAKIIEQVFKQGGISYRFVKAADLDALTSGIIFYPFNAQSNCRAVANRRLTHIFITHGESNKIASVKPIIRIYDHIITAGQAGIERFLANKIFNCYDVNSGRLVKMGDTFIGRTGLASVGQGKKTIFYAPTWEGGIELENYSSLSYTNEVANCMKHFSKQYDVNTVLIKPHPNTGHRCREYNQYLISLVELLLSEGLKIVLFKPHITIPFHIVWRLKRKGVVFESELNKYYAVLGFCDISAIETQFLNEQIYYYIFCSKIHKSYLLGLKVANYYKTHAIEFTQSELPNRISEIDFNELKEYLIDNSCLNIPISERINYLLNNLHDYAEYI
ncbi:hypothetical protein [Pasteurella bettyae]|uniref:CDP-glycerol:poly(Glycerophosphate) glycerophosphotransferase domain protein n=1 Tax=Pasteurella bettyae CCUG 2042 TaxID=1095749 RepID=I3DAM5_9PAST|nr:hypothetical protein [Pasteurella bettyae]EIJ68768.1 CDP-glycerol:poly(glycerophosphate) glycerophosphotransferase domain protein [Pasteurella bettyae CCUG 2042]SUB20918.1 Uncharacterised protein [Pasteurella bettyae]